MRLCSICDKKIEGGWCKNCHRFVKSYEIANDIRLNERHDLMNDAGCTYHTDTTGHGTKQTAGTNRSTVTRTATASSSANTTKTTGKKTGKKLATVIAVIYFLIMFVGKIFSSFVGEIREFSQGVMEEFGQDEILQGEEVVVPMRSDELTERASKRNLALQELTPVEIEEEDTYVAWYYNPEEIKTLEYPCDDIHIRLDCNEFEQWIVDITDGTCEIYENEFFYGNYLLEYDNESYVQFSSYREYVYAEESYVTVDFDTATERVHRVEFVSVTPEDETLLYYGALIECGAETDWSENEFSKQFADALEEVKDTGFAYLYPAENVMLSVMKNEDYILTRIMPTYETK